MLLANLSGHGFLPLRSFHAQIPIDVHHVFQVRRLLCLLELLLKLDGKTFVLRRLCEADLP